MKFKYGMGLSSVFSFRNKKTKSCFFSFWQTIFSEGNVMRKRNFACFSNWTYLYSKSHFSVNSVFWSEFSYWGRCLMGISPTSLFYYMNLDSQRCNVVVNVFIHLYSSNKFRYKQVQRTTNWFGMVFSVMFF